MPAWLGIIGSVVAIIVFLGTVVVYFRGSADKGTITTLQNSNEALIQRVAVLESNEARMSVRLEHLEKENAQLQAQRPSAAAIAELLLRSEALAAQLATHDATMRRYIDRGTPK